MARVRFENLNADEHVLAPALTKRTSIAVPIFHFLGLSLRNLGLVQTPFLCSLRKYSPKANCVRTYLCSAISSHLRAARSHSIASRLPISRNQ